MVPDANDPPTEHTEDDATTVDGGDGFDEARLHAVVRDAVEDALLGVVGTLLLVAVAFVLVVAGVQAALWGMSPLGTAAGVAVTAFGLYLAAATLELVPPMRDWM
ncbi:MAG: hypothetical protein ABEJ78_01175 [Haloferacaceae archaeon]